MTYDLEILKELFLPLLQEMASHSSGLKDDIGSEMFWIEFNSALLGTLGELQRKLADYSITDTERYATQFESLKKEYMASLSQCYCAGQISPAITLLLDRADAAFMEEVDFQKHMLAAMSLAGRAAIRDELQLNDEFTGADISDEEISGAFSAMQREATRDELRGQLQGWDEEEQAVPPPQKRKRTGGIPLMFLRFAAAAAVGTVATVGVVKVYDSKNRQVTPAVNQNSITDSNKLTARPVTDTIRKADTSRPGGMANGADSNKNTTGLYLVLKGNIVDTATSELVKDVVVTLLDEKGKKQTVYSKDGTFRFRLPLHHNFVITGKKEGYHSARISLSTKDAPDSDAGVVIEGVLRFSKDP